MKISKYKSGKINYANVYLTKDESIGLKQSETAELKKECRVIIFTGGTKSYREALALALTKICRL